MVNEALRQALELQAEFLAARPRRTSAGTFWKSRSPQPDEGTKSNRSAGAVGSQDPSGVNALTKQRKKTMDGEDETTDAQKVNGNRSEETLEEAGTEHPLCIGLGRPGNHVHRGPSA
jgi:hypothetical protein